MAPKTKTSKRPARIKQLKKSAAKKRAPRAG